MNEHFSVLKTVAKSTEDLLADRLYALVSTEIKHSAGVLRSSIQPCIEEIKQSTLLLRTHLEACIENLDAAEDLWHSKRRISEIPTVQILEAIGKVVGIWKRLQQEAENLKPNLIQQAQQKWMAQIEELECDAFFDKKKQQYQAFIVGDKKQLFRKSLPIRLDSASKAINDTINQELIRFYQIGDKDDFAPLSSFTEALDQSAKIGYIAEVIQGHFSQIDRAITQASHFSLRQDFQEALEEWQKFFASISHKKVQDFKQKVSEKIKERIVAKIDNCLQAIQKLVEYTIKFYHDLLTRQNRYRQETLKQQKAEQAWIVQQREHLKRLVKDLERISSDR
ncbi:hypothetical protein ACQ4M3_30925 [Leptolyngbya sp. AN03gr2]|uniref:hypothetical protein n=1 Tax=unclassified Leptolyngbya TaxID=2650499 RepID=UPI003D31B098